MPTLTFAGFVTCNGALRVCTVYRDSPASMLHTRSHRSAGGLPGCWLAACLRLQPSSHNPVPAHAVWSLCHALPECNTTRWEFHAQRTLAAAAMIESQGFPKTAVLVACLLANNVLAVVHIQLHQFCCIEQASVNGHAVGTSKVFSRLSLCLSTSLILER